MNLPRFISQRIQKTKSESFTSTVVKVGIASIAIGLAVMIISFGILVGYKQAIKDKLFSLSSHIQVSKITLNQSYEEIPMPINTNFYKHHSKNLLIRHVQAVANKAGMLKSNEELAGIIIKGVGKDYDWNIFSQNLVEGRKINFTDTTTFSNEVIISKRIAGQLKIKLADEVLIYFIQTPPRVRKVKVVGIYETGLEEFDKNFIVGDLSLVQKMNEWDANTCGHYEVFIKDFDDLNEATGIINSEIDLNMKATRVTEMFRAIFDWLGLLDKNILIVLGLILVVASFNMISVLLVMMMERTSMIGMLKALGTDNTQIRKIFVYNGLTIILRGIVYGNVLGIGLSAVQYYFEVIPLDPENYYINHVPIAWDWLTILLLNLATVILILVVITIPTLIVSKMRVVEALKFND